MKKKTYGPNDGLTALWCRHRHRRRRHVQRRVEIVVVVVLQGGCGVVDIAVVDTSLDVSRWWWMWW